jgi:hypothetical protein
MLQIVNKGGVKMKLTNEELTKLIFCIDLAIQKFGENKELEDLADKLIEMKNGNK